MKPLCKIRMFVSCRAIILMSVIYVLAAIGGVGTVHAANCPASFYLNPNKECKYCEGGYYCPGDDIRYECPKDKWSGKYQQFFDDTFISFLEIKILDSGWSQFVFVYNGREYYERESIDRCVRLAHFYTKNYSCLSLVAYDPIKQEYPVKCTNYYEAGPGYYLSPYLADFDSSYMGYTGVKPCTNAPANAHYTGPGTPDSEYIDDPYIDDPYIDIPDDMIDGTIKDANDCPWECDAGYGHTSDDRCLPLCRIGDTAMNGINIYAEKHTKYAMAVPRNGGVCWINATRDNGGKLVPVN